MITFIESFLLTETLMLIYNTFRDVKTKEIDSRFNYLAIGAILMFIAYFQPSFWIIIVSIIVSSLTVFVFRWKGFFASGDLEAISWVVFTLGLFDYWKMIVFLIMLTLFYAFGLVMIKITKQGNRLPGYPMILGSFLITLLTFYSF